jgi:prepilin-type processing-associated H-X9-DG protein
MDQHKTRNIIKRFLIVLLVGIFLIGIIIAIILPGLDGLGSRWSQNRAQCFSNELNIAQALIIYGAMHGHFPPAYIADKDGRPLYSWRVLILPFLDNIDKSFYKNFQNNFYFDEAWDSPHNRQMLDSMKTPDVYTCPATGNKHETNYVMIVGPGMLSDGPHSVSQWDISDGSAYTLMIVETCDSGIHWAEPRDITLENVVKHHENPNIPGVQSRHGGGANVSFCDGHQYWLRDDVDPKVLKALATIAGGEEIKDSDF